MEVTPKVHTQLDNNETLQLDNGEVKALVDQYLEGDGEATLSLLEMARPLIYSELTRQRIPPNVEAEDVVSELNIILLDSLPSYKPELASFRTFAFHIIHRRITRIIATLAGSKSYKGEPRRTVHQLSEEIDILDDSNNGMSLEDDEVLSDAVRLIASALNPSERKIYLDYLQDIPTTLIAERAKTTNVKINETIAACTERIKEEFRQRGALGYDGHELQKTWAFIEG
jgi:RNA polymerase sigma factor (sigma-70 family)